MNKNLESLRRLKRGTTNTSSSPFGLANLFGGGSSSKIASSTNPGVGGGAGAGTDAEGEAANEETERIRAQMESDTRALRREVAELGLGLLDEKVEKDEREKDGKDGMDGKEDEGMTEAWQRLARAAGGSTEDF